MSGTLDGILQDAYHAFAAPAPSGLNVCTTCCMAPADEAAMLAGPVDQITDAQLSSWLNAAFINGSFPGPVCTYLAPRLMELAIKVPEAIELELVLARLPLGETSQWTDPQNDVIRRFHSAYFERFRTNTETDPFLDTLFCMFGLCGFPAQQSVDCVNQWRDKDIINRLWLDRAGPIGAPVWQSVWWNWTTNMPKHTQSRDSVKEWLTGPALRARLTAYLETADPETNTWARAAELEASFAAGIDE